MSSDTKVYHQPPGAIRLVCSLLAVAAIWMVQGAYHAFHSWKFWNGIPITDQLHLTWTDTRGWLLWTAIFCVIGWVVVGLPIVALGGRVLSASLWRVSLSVGAAGGAIMLIPTLFWTVGVGQADTLLHPFAWVFCGVAFAIAVFTMILYRLLVQLATRAGAGVQPMIRT